MPTCVLPVLPSYPQLSDRFTYSECRTGANSHPTPFLQRYYLQLTSMEAAPCLPVAHLFLRSTQASHLGWCPRPLVSLQVFLKDKQKQINRAGEDGCDRSVSTCRALGEQCLQRKPLVLLLPSNAPRGTDGRSAHCMGARTRWSTSPWASTAGL